MGGPGGRVRGVRVDVNEELKFLCEIQKEKIGGVGGGVGSGGSCWGVRVDVNEELKLVKIQKKIGGRGEGGEVGLVGGQGGCE